MDVGLIILGVILALLAIAALGVAIRFIIWIITKLYKRGSYYPFKYGGFDSDNGYENGHRK